MQTQTQKTPKPSIKENVYGNWYGYLGARKVTAFFDTPEHTQEQAANKWLQEQEEKRTQLDIHDLRRRYREARREELLAKRAEIEREIDQLDDLADQDELDEQTAVFAEMKR